MINSAPCSELVLINGENDNNSRANGTISLLISMHTQTHTHVHADAHKHTHTLNHTHPRAWGVKIATITSAFQQLTDQTNTERKGFFPLHVWYEADCLSAVVVCRCVCVCTPTMFSSLSELELSLLRM